MENPSVRPSVRKDGEYGEDEIVQEHEEDEIVKEDEEDKIVKDVK